MGTIIMTIQSRRDSRGVNWKLIIIMILLLLFILYKKRYLNPFDQFLSASQEEIMLVRLDQLPSPMREFDLVGSHKLDDRIIKYEINKDKSRDENTRIYISDGKKMILEFQKKLTEDRYLFITYLYSDSVLKERVELSSSDISRSYVELINNTFGGDSGLGEFHTYYRSSSKGIPNFDLINSINILTELEKFGITSEELKRKSEEILYNQFLESWTEKTKRKFPNDNLGNVKIEKTNILR